MAKNQNCRNRTVRVTPVQLPAAEPAAGIPEPSVRRWPHPVDGMEMPERADPMLHYIRCALTYQNQLLAEIKALVQQIAEDAGAPRE